MNAAARLYADFSVQRAEFLVEFAVTIQPGERVALMGPSGAGKTTIIDALSGLSSIESGTITLDEHTLVSSETHTHLAPHRRRIALLRQDGDLFPHLNARDNIAFAIRIRGVATVQARASATEWLERIGLGNLALRYPAELSGGQLRRIALLRALAATPRLLLVDEPFASLDVLAAAAMRELIVEQLQQHPVTTILVSHDARDALTLADRLIVIERGQMVQQGTVAEVLAKPQTSFTEALAATLRPA